MTDGTPLPGWLITDVLGNHLWQSVIVLAAAALLTLALRNNRAEVRYWVWLAASIKFLVPFSAFMLIGSQLAWRSAVPPVSSEVGFMVEMLSQPFSQSEMGLAVPRTSAWPKPGSHIPALITAIWFCGLAAVLATWALRWLRVACLVWHAQRVKPFTEVKSPVAIVSVNLPLEPGIYGIFRPVLLWPQSLTERLNEQQMATILAHELCHLRRRDNLAAAMQMLVSAVFWFHPLVWWLGARLIDERERACDEEVIRRGGNPRVYAESILKTCQFCVESPLPCIAGVTGSNLKGRIEQIMKSHDREPLPLWKKGLLAAAAVAAVTIPIGIGVVSAPPLRAQSVTSNTSPIDVPILEVTSVKPNKSSGTFVAMQVQPGGRINITNAPIRLMIRTAYGLQDSQILGGPDWINSDRFDVIAKAEGNPTQPQLQLLLRTVLAQRFNLQAHQETRELPVYALTLARSDKRLGQQLRQAGPDCTAMRKGPPPSGPQSPARDQCGFRSLPGSLTARGVSLSALATSLSGNPAVNRIVLDRTGLSGDFDFDLKYTPDQMPAGPMRDPNGVELPAIDPNGPSVFTALQEQLGLKLELQRAPVEVLVIDRAEPPTPD